MHVRVLCILFQYSGTPAKRCQTAHFPLDFYVKYKLLNLKFIHHHLFPPTPPQNSHLFNFCSHQGHVKHMHPLLHSSDVKALLFTIISQFICQSIAVYYHKGIQLVPISVRKSLCYQCNISRFFTLTKALQMAHHLPKLSYCNDPIQLAGVCHSTATVTYNT